MYSGVLSMAKYFSAISPKGCCDARPAVDEPKALPPDDPELQADNAAIHRALSKFFTMGCTTLSLCK